MHALDALKLLCRPNIYRLSRVYMLIKQALTPRAPLVLLLTLILDTL